MRHGSVLRHPGIYMNERDVTLTLKGKLQIIKLIPLLRRFAPNNIIVSPVRRCIETAKILSPFMTRPYVQDARLRERVFPSLFGKTIYEIAEIYGKETLSRISNESENLELPEEETFDQARTRVIQAVTEHVQMSKDRIVFISHGGPHSWLLCEMLGLDISSVRKFSLGEGRVSLFEFHNDGTFARIIQLNGIWGVLP